LKPFEGLISLILRHLFSPLNNTRLSHLCGPTDAHLRSIEAALQVKIAHRHEQFKVDGTNAQAKRGMELLQALYELAARPIEAATVQLMLAGEREQHLREPPADPGERDDADDDANYHICGNIVPAHNFNLRPVFVIEAAGDVHTYIKVCLFVVEVVVVVAICDHVIMYVTMTHAYRTAAIFAPPSSRPTCIPLLLVRVHADVLRT
jgi:hypothetical protein